MLVELSNCNFSLIARRVTMVEKLDLSYFSKIGVLTVARKTDLVQVEV